MGTDKDLSFSMEFDSGTKLHQQQPGSQFSIKNCVASVMAMDDGAESSISGQFIAAGLKYPCWIRRFTDRPADHQSAGTRCDRLAGSHHPALITPAEARRPDPRSHEGERFREVASQGPQLQR